MQSQTLQLRPLVRGVLVGVIALIAGGSMALGQIAVPVRYVVNKSDTADTGTSQNTYISFIGFPSMNAAGRVAFMSQVWDLTAQTRTTVIASDRNGSLHVEAIAGSAAAVADGVVRTWNQFSSSNHVALADNGRIGVLAKVTPALPAYSEAAEATMAVFGSAAEAGWSLVAANGTPFQGGVVNSSLLFTTFSAADGRAAFASWNGSNSVQAVRETDDGLASVDARSGWNSTPATQIVAQAGNGEFAYVGQDNLEVFLRGRVSNVQGTIASSTTTTIAVEGAGQRRVYADVNVPAAINGSGQTVIKAGLLRVGFPAIPAIIRFDGDVASAVLFQGQSVGPGGLTIASFGPQRFVIADSGVMLGAVVLAGPGITASNDDALVLVNVAGARVLAREGDPVADLPGSTFLSFNAYALTPAGRAAFSCAVTEGGGAGRSASFCIDDAARPRLLIADGLTKLKLADGRTSRVNAHSRTTCTGGNDGVARQLIDGVGFVTSVEHFFGNSIVVLPFPCPADIAAAGAQPGYDGRLDNNDFIAFIDFFFTGDRRADRGVAGGLSGADGLFDNNDFVAFINEFFAGCN